MPGGGEDGLGGEQAGSGQLKGGPDLSRVRSVGSCDVSGGRRPRSASTGCVSKNLMMLRIFAQFLTVKKR